MSGLKEVDEYLSGLSSNVHFVVKECRAISNYATLAGYEITLIDMNSTYAAEYTGVGQTMLLAARAALGDFD